MEEIIDFNFNRENIRESQLSSSRAEESKWSYTNVVQITEPSIQEKLPFEEYTHNPVNSARLNTLSQKSKKGRSSTKQVLPHNQNLDLENLYTQEESETAQIASKRSSARKGIYEISPAKPEIDTQPKKVSIPATKT